MKRKIFLILLILTISVGTSDRTDARTAQTAQRTAETAQKVAEAEQHRQERITESDLEDRMLVIQNRLFEEFDVRLQRIITERDRLANDLCSARRELDELRREYRSLQNETADLRVMVETLTKRTEDLSNALSVALSAQRMAEEALEAERCRYGE